MKRWFGALAMLGVLAAGAESSAQEIQLRGPLAGAPSCRRCVLYREGRVSIAPSIGMSLVDDFSRSLWLGAQVHYHVLDFLSFGVYGAYSYSFNTPLADGVGSQLRDINQLRGNVAVNTPNIPNGANFNNQLGRLVFMVSPQINLIPLRGKLALFQNVFIDTDFYIFGGLAIVGLTERSDFNRTNPSDMDLTANQNARSFRVQPTGTFGFGLNLFFNRFLSVAFEYRAYPFSWNTSGTDENSVARSCGSNGMQTCNGFPDYLVAADSGGNGQGGRFILDANDRTFRFNQMVNLSFNIFLPTAPRISR